MPLGVTGVDDAEVLVVDVVVQSVRGGAVEVLHVVGAVVVPVVE